MEEAAKVIGGVAGELVFFMRSFLLGFLMRLGYEPIIFFRRVFRQPKLRKTFAAARCAEYQAVGIFQLLSVAQNHVVGKGV